jgi:hypothetical protein
VRRLARFGARVAGSSLFREPRIVDVRRWWLCVCVWRVLWWKGASEAAGGVQVVAMAGAQAEMERALGNGQRWISAVDLCTASSNFQDARECPPGPENSQMSCREERQSGSRTIQGQQSRLVSDSTGVPARKLVLPTWRHLGPAP